MENSKQDSNKSTEPKVNQEKSQELDEKDLEKVNGGMASFKPAWPFKG